jgi:SAM-dependent methyltransferase
VGRTDYAPLAATFDERYASESYAPIARYLAAWIGGAARVLEVGCGTGHWVALLARPGVLVCGTDPSPEMLAVARRRGPVAQGRAEALPFSSGSFDGLFCLNAHHHFDDLTAFAHEAYRTLVPGGRLTTLALDPHTGLDRWWIYDFFEGALEHDLARYPATSALRARLGTAGFVELASEVVLHEPGGIAAPQALARGRAWTSQLADLPDDEWERGVTRIRAGGPDLILEADLRLWATTALRARDEG